MKKLSIKIKGFFKQPKVAVSLRFIAIMSGIVGGIFYSSNLVVSKFLLSICYASYAITDLSRFFKVKTLALLISVGVVSIFYFIKASNPETTVVNLDESTSQQQSGKIDESVNISSQKKIIDSSSTVIAGKIVTQTNSPNATQIVTDTITINFNSNAYKKPSNKLTRTIFENLKGLKQKYPSPPVIIIQVESGNSQRRKVALQLERFLSEYWLGGYPSGNTSIGRFPEHPISIIYNSKNDLYVKDFLVAICPYMPKEYYLESDDNYSSNRIILYLNGVPLFSNNGSVIFE